MSEATETETIVRLLAWYREMGADAAMDADPLDWHGRPQAGPGAAFQWPAVATPAHTAPAAPPNVARIPSPPAPPARAPAASTARPLPPSNPAPAARAFAAIAPDAAVLAARTAARSASTLAELRRVLGEFDGCALKATAKNLCFARGADQARLMLIGEAPGREEDQAGQPFVGPPGQLLDRMLAAIGCTEADVHLANIVYWRPPGNRTPTPQEAQACRPFLERQIELVAPELIVLLGGAAAKHVLDAPESIMNLRGAWRDVRIGDRTIPAMATLHPAYLLRSPAAKRLVWADLLAVKAARAGRG